MKRRNPSARRQAAIRPNSAASSPCPSFRMRLIAEIVITWQVARYKDCELCWRETCSSLHSPLKRYERGRYISGPTGLTARDGAGGARWAARRGYLAAPRAEGMEHRGNPGSQLPADRQHGALSALRVEV